MSTSRRPPPIHVVAGLLIDGKRVCVTRRRPDVHQGGKWEFPGGKLEPGESPLAGLRRELREELGITVIDARPYMELKHSYDDIDVLLDIWYVASHRGSVHPREGQEMRWAEIERLDPGEFPQADRPVLRRLQLPRLYVVSDVRRFGEEEFARRLDGALAVGARLVQLREPQMERRAFCAYARRLASACRRHGARLLINADPAWLNDAEADGVHLNSRRLMALSSRPVGTDVYMGVSCHDAEELLQAAKVGADFVVLGPVQPTASHPGDPTLGWERFAALCATVSLPVYAIGGMQVSDLPRALELGAYGVAMIRGIWQSDNVASIVRQISD